MKHTKCRLCDRNLENLTFDEINVHVAKHVKEKKDAENEARSQSGMDSFFT